MIRRSSMSVVVVVIATIVVVLVGRDAAAGLRPEYAARATVPLINAVHGLDGRLELLEDVRIRPEFRSLLWGSDSAMYCYQGGADALRAFCASLSAVPVRRALLRVVTRADREVIAHELERELGDLSTVHLYDDRRPTYVVTVDLSIGFGS